jgi:hypothetical protein
MNWCGFCILLYRIKPSNFYDTIIKKFLQVFSGLDDLNFNQLEIAKDGRGLNLRGTLIEMLF